MFSKVAILGAGLLGGSLALALKRRKITEHVSLWARRQEIVDDIGRLDIAHFASTDIALSVQDAELVILATPIGIMPDLCRKMMPHLSDFAIITDVGSVKAPIVQSLTEVLQGKCRFVGSHPMAGGDQAGLIAIKEDLFNGAVCLMTPTGETDASALVQVRNFWAALNMTVKEMSPQEHDHLVARISHLPHLVAAALCVAATREGREALQLCGNGFRDSTRVAGGLPEMWQEILIQNRVEVMHTLKYMQETLADAADMLEKGDPIPLQDFLKLAASIRHSVASRGLTDE